MHDKLLGVCRAGRGYPDHRAVIAWLFGVPDEHAWSPSWIRPSSALVARFRRFGCPAQNGFAATINVSEKPLRPRLSARAKNTSCGCKIKYLAQSMHEQSAL
jgi:hypothetical protein